MDLALGKIYKMVCVKIKLRFLGKTKHGYQALTLPHVDAGFGNDMLMIDGII